MDIKFIEIKIIEIKIIYRKYVEGRVPALYTHINFKMQITPYWCQRSYSIIPNIVFLYSIGQNKTVPTLQTSDSLESRYTKARLHSLLYHKILDHFNVAH